MQIAKRFLICFCLRLLEADDVANVRSLFVKRKFASDFFLIAVQNYEKRRYVGSSISSILGLAAVVIVIYFVSLFWIVVVALHVEIEVVGEVEDCFATFCVEGMFGNGFFFSVFFP